MEIQFHPDLRGLVWVVFWVVCTFGVGKRKQNLMRLLGLGLDSVLSKDTLFVLEEEIRILILYILLIFTFSPIK